jgi:hypothetical protein
MARVFAVIIAMDERIAPPGPPRDPGIIPETMSV